MITCGIDVGIEYTKIIILKDGNPAGKAFGVSGGARRAENVKHIYAQACEAAGITEADVETVVITGKGKYNTGLQGKTITELAALESAVRKQCPEATQAVSIGADEIIVAVLSKERIEEYTLNQKCSAGIGLFLEETAEDLQLSYEQLDSARLNKAGLLNDTCVAFAKMDILELLNAECPREEILAAALRFATIRTAGVINDITLPDDTKTVLAGGVCTNKKFVECLNRYSGKTYEVMPDPEYALAFGAACYLISG